MKNWRDISYLESGDPKQKEAFEAINSSGIFEMLAGFDPVLTGTYPIEIYLPDSDIDIICCFENAGAFLERLQSSFSPFHDFETKTKTIRGIQSVIGRFEYAGFLFEVFGQAVPVEKQNAYRHMVIEYTILSSNDHSFRKKILELKKKGLSTEKAFAILLEIEGDPYTGLLEYGAGV
ncbi:MAG: DUF4269 domain-containing protein [Bacteroidetes bacterium]|nr:DUF4269 domain-containing protein [Bacteroidota bacterium]